MNAVTWICWCWERGRGRNEGESLNLRYSIRSCEFEHQFVCCESSFSIKSCSSKFKVSLGISLMLQCEGCWISDIRRSIKARSISIVTSRCRRELLDAIVVVNVRGIIEIVGIHIQSDSKIPIIAGVEERIAQACNIYVPISRC